MHILLTGATGFIGDHLVHELEKSNHEIYILTRKQLKDRANVHYIEWLTSDKLPNLEDLPIDICINLAGEGLMDEKWSNDRKKAIVNSRIEATSALLSIVKKMKIKPKLWINASAIGAYNSSKSTIYLDTEENPYAANFLGKTVYEWEKTASAANDLGIRVVYARFGLVLGTNGGSFPAFKKLFQTYTGGKLGSGRQWYSWIHVDDVVAAMLFIFQHEQINGIVNFTAPHPVQEKKFAERLGKKMHKPYNTPIPKKMISLILGERAMTILDSQRAYPEKLMSHHFEFQFETLQEAIDDLIE
ncbi:TIGR01777 family protein [Listeria sp. FSL L7-1485]|uniref:TIGR01777 family protein n=1 Tax=Listeria immobilis TaxID=2713502 RepID=A0A7X1C9N8_9LIST|nr:TIGR01777 family oxidoreductase [Listeria immobilis]MBC1483339.1 TIGR01777 family protein [Listeria immobilis]MBC1489514.1 TIGR01777 family protein [Listeria immobilis]MBC1507680.1 TIGR01777 family protein [Listeria immobilis]MBC1510545.1 TIGR01777 family protein [Listeria immobilis]MBC1517296.1 TIGR01777 family protein [Listeria immobilis]